MQNWKLKMWGKIMRITAQKYKIFYIFLIWVLSIVGAGVLDRPWNVNHTVRYPYNFVPFVRIFGTSRTPSPTTLFHLKLNKYIKYGTLYKTDNLVFYSLKRKYHLRLSEQTAFGFLLSKSTVTHPNIRRKKVL